MSGDDLRIEIEGDEGSAAKRQVEPDWRQVAAREQAEKLQWQRQAAIERTARTVEVADREYDTIVTGIHAAQTEMAQAEQAQARAWEEGRFGDAAKFQSANSVAAARLVELEGAKAHLEARRQQMLHQQQHIPQQPQQPVDPVEAMAAISTPRSAAWIREHREFLSTERGRAKVFAAHNDALSEGHAPDSDSYFDHVNKFVGGRSPAKMSPNERAAQMYGSRGPKVHLTKGEYERSKDGSLIWNYGPKKGQAIGPEEFARRKLAMMQQGVWDKMDS
jgi:hypothetical protein